MPVPFEALLPYGIIIGVCSSPPKSHSRRTAMISYDYGKAVAIHAIIAYDNM